MKNLTIFFFIALMSCSSFDEDHNACLDEVNKTYEPNDLKNKVKHMEMCMMQRGYHFTTDTNGLDGLTSTEMVISWEPCHHLNQDLGTAWYSHIFRLKK